MADILLAEDDEAVRSFVKRALELDGHTVTAQEDGAAAAETLARENGRFDLILSDIKMPIMDGIALRAHRRTRFSAGPDPADDRLCRPA